jgi:hypothetical protein
MYLHFTTAGFFGNKKECKERHKSLKRWKSLQKASGK